MGTVWVAHNSVLDIDVALKLMRFEQFQADPKRIFRRLLQEARAAARLEHPAIVRVFDFGLTEVGSPYIVMELLHGESLAELMAREPPMEATKAVQLLLPIADALATAHGRGIIHRDIKPENLFLSTDDYGRLQPKIVDFGVARFLEGGRTLTRSGALMGTPDYMAPEQARGEAGIDTRVDIWALCVVLYELIAGFRPFGSPDANYLAVLRAIVHDDMNPAIRGAVDDALWLILERGLRKKPHERWDTMRVLGEALALWLYERGVREDVLGASIKATWLQSGLGGVKIETASMSPPANPPPESGTERSASQPELGPGRAFTEIVARPVLNVSLAGVRPYASHSLSLPSPRSEQGSVGGSVSLSEAINEVLKLPRDAVDSAPESGSPAAFSDSEPPTTPVSSNLRRVVSSSPLVEQTREIRRLVLASIGVTALLGLAMVLLLWDQRRLPNPSPPPATPSLQAKVEPTPPRPTSVAEPVAVPEPVPVPAPSTTTASLDEPALPAEVASASASTIEPTAEEPSIKKASVRPRVKPRAQKRRQKNKYELGF